MVLNSYTGHTFTEKSTKGMTTYGKDYVPKWMDTI